MAMLAARHSLLNVKSQRKLFSDIARSKGLDPLVAANWYSIPYSSIAHIQGVNSIVYCYKKNFVSALARIFPDIGLDKTKLAEFNAKDTSTSPTEQKRLIQYLANKLGYTNYQDYYKITTLDFRNNDLRYLLYPYNESASKTIMSTFPDHEWHPWLFENSGHLWHDNSNHKKYVDWLGKEMGYKCMSDWYRITATDIHLNKGKSLLCNFYHNSVSEILLSIYPDHQWNIWQFHDTVPVDFWKSSENCNRYLEWLGKKIGFTKQEDWYNITKKNFQDNSGKSILEYFGGKPAQVVMETFTKDMWEEELFACQPLNFDKREDVLHVLSKVEDKVNLQVLEEWYVVSRIDLMSVPNGQRLYKTHNKDLLKILQIAYPDHQWDETKFHRHAKNKRQLFLEKILHELFDDQTILVNARKSTRLKYDFGNQPYMELDLYLPGLQIAFEYQDLHHYADVWYTSQPLETYQQRDEMKMKATKENGITLIHVPYWWDGSKESLISTIREAREDLLPLFAHNTHPPIPTQAPYHLLDSQIKDYYVPGLGVPMLASSIHTLNNFESKKWWIMEKYDGIRAFWSPDDGHFVSRSGRKLLVPTEIQSKFSKLKFWLDGEIWFGVGSFDEAGKVAHKSSHIDWENFKFVVFDAPKHTGSYQERYEFIKTNMISDPIVIIPQYEECTGTDHVLQATQQVIEKGGEGIILRNPSASYKHGRSKDFLKLKKFRDAEARIKSKAARDTWLCETPNGVTFSAPMEAALKNKVGELTEGSIISFKHRGYASDGVPKLSIIYRVRPDLVWDDLRVLPIKPSTFKEYAPHLHRVSNRKPLGYWGDKENVRNWFDQFAKNKGMDPQLSETWNDITTADLQTSKGSASIGWKYGTMSKALQFVYPNATLYSSRKPHES